MMFSTELDMAQGLGALGILDMYKVQLYVDARPPLANYASSCGRGRGAPPSQPNPYLPLRLQGLMALARFGK